MPVFSFFQWTQDRGDLLQPEGPIIQVEIGIPAALEEFCLSKNIQIPQPITGYALIDTGAAATAVHEECLLALGVLPIDAIPTHTPAGTGRSFVYPAKISFPGLQLTGVPMDRVVGCELKWQTQDGRDVVMLLGRDLLRYFLLVYNGKSSDLTLAY